ncbi:MAG TPA: FecR domain-containing protein [Puia sp.]|nr:FecR domain-containing protein [Puia sp.]
MTRNDFIKLYEKDLSGNCTPEEKRMLEEYQDDFRWEEGPWDADKLGEKEKTGELIYAGVEAGMRRERQAAVRKIFRTGAVAAAILIPLVLGGAYLWSLRKPAAGDAPVVSQRQRYKNDVQPGGDKAVLTLANGSVLVLDSSAGGLLTRQGNVRVVKTNHGQLSYMPAGPAAGGDDAVRSLYNTISTPRGGQFEVVLPDGSKVWLNAASSLRFPTAFTGSERRVELTGEGYFDIAKDASRPFKVGVGASEVEVLGTEFNIMAYTDEGSMNTTLVSGAVKLKSGGHALQLKPGEQAEVKTDGSVDLDRTVDVDVVTAWKYGRFEFNGNIKGIMRQIARWYDVDVKYKGNVSDIALGGAISRTDSVSQILKIFEMTGSIHFIIDGKTITVEP